MSHISEKVQAAKSARQMFELARSMKDPKEREIFVKEYCAVIIATHAKDDKRLTYEEAHSILRQNLCYMAGYFGDDVRKEIEEMYGAEHPVFGSIVKNGPPSTKEAFYSGIRLGLQRDGIDAPLKMRAAHRPPNFKELSPEEQRQVDKGLGILDWDGK